MAREVLVKSVLNKTKRHDSWFLSQYTINPFSACAFNCLFCYIRGSRYGTHMEEKVSVKANLLPVLEKELKRRADKNEYGFIVVSSATDPYLQIEEKYELTRRVLELILKFRFPVHIITRSPLVLRDVDLLHQINANAILPPEFEGRMNQKAIVSFSFSTIDEQIAKIFEPGAPSPLKRLEALRQIVSEGLLCGVSLMPLLPYITDKGEHLQQMYETFADAGAHYVLAASLTLFGTNAADSKPLFYAALNTHYPDLLEKYIRLFGEGSEMPKYYTTALRKKTDSLAAEFHVRNSILNLSPH